MSPISAGHGLLGALLELEMEPAHASVSLVEQRSAAQAEPEPEARGVLSSGGRGGHEENQEGGDVGGRSHRLRADTAPVPSAVWTLFSPRIARPECGTRRGRAGFYAA